MKKRKLKVKACPCHSGSPYRICCKPYHTGDQRPPTAEALMRSRYAAYALGLVDYVIDTTDPDGPHFNADLDRWRSELLRFSKETLFEGLRVLAATESTVLFEAGLSRDGRPVGFVEQSRFRRVDERWLYTDGQHVR